MSIALTRSLDAAPGVESEAEVGAGAGAEAEVEADWSVWGLGEEGQFRKKEEKGEGREERGRRWLDSAGYEVIAIVMMTMMMMI